MSIPDWARACDWDNRCKHGLRAHGCGYGYGLYRDGDMYGDGDVEIKINKKDAWKTYHYIARSPEGYRLRNGDIVKIGETLRHDGELIPCEHGYHSSLLADDAAKYAPRDSVLTECRVWGRVIVDIDKLVSEYRQIVREIK